MKRITILLALVYWAGTALAQTANSKRALTPAEQSAAIEKVRGFALSYTKNLPNYTCVQLTRQMIMRDVFGKLAMAAPEIIEEQVSFVITGRFERCRALTANRWLPTVPISIAALLREVNSETCSKLYSIRGHLPTFDGTAP
jgi:hypothetical protein